jgi:hypothetical protein
VAGYTDNEAIKNTLPKKFSSNKGIPLSLPLSRGLTKVAFDCAHRTRTVSPCASWEQGRHLAVPYVFLVSSELRGLNDSPAYVFTRSFAAEEGAQ